MSVSAGTRIYFMDAYCDRKGQPYISIAEVSVGNHSGQKKRQRLFVHAEDIDKFAGAFAEITEHVKSNNYKNGND